MNQKRPVIALTGGGSGGHIVPILSLAQELKKLEPNCQTVYIGHKGDNFDSLELPKNNFDFLVFLNAGKFRRYHGESLLSHLADFKTIALNIRDIFRVIKSTISAYRLLKKMSVDILFAKGGFVSVPVGLAAKLRKIPIVTHDSDAVGGLANRIVGRWASVRATGMPTSLYPKTKQKLIYVGIPLNERIKPVSEQQAALFKKHLGIPSTSPVLLAAGGGLGSQKINDLMVTIVPRLIKEVPDLYVLHITGQQHLKIVKKGYSVQMPLAELKHIKAIGFTPEFYKYSGAADIILSRAGATAIAEFEMQAKTCIIIPSPFLTGGHQLKNAEELARQDAAVILQESTTSDELLAVINSLLADNQRRHQLAHNLHKLAKPGAAEELAKIILRYAG